MAEAKDRAARKKGKGPRVVDALSEGQVVVLHDYLMSIVGSRAQIANRLGYSYGGDRDIYEALGYPTTITYSDYVGRYLRNEVAGAVIDLPVDECWRTSPEIEESEAEDTEFEKRVREVASASNLFGYMSRVDRLASIGRYAVLFLGFDDGAPLDQPVVSARSLLYVMSYSEANATISEYDSDPKSRRFSLPNVYSIQHRVAGIGSSTSTRTTRVHWTRVVHVAGGLLESDVEGTPRLERIFNRLIDIDRIAGGSSEMFWRAGFPGLDFAIRSDATPTDQDLEDMRDQIEDYIHGLQRYIRTRGVDVNSLAVQLADPRGHMQVQMDLVACGVRIPKRILIGSERGELSSSQDEETWLRQVQARQEKFCGPAIVRPTIDRLIDVGVVPKPATGMYDCAWKDLFAPSEKDQADVGLVRAQSVATLVNAIGSFDVIPEEVAMEKMFAFSGADVDKIRQMREETAATEKADEVEAEAEGERGGSSTE